MNIIDFLKKMNTVLIFILLVAAVFLAGYLISRLRKPISMVHVAVDSLHVGKQK